MKKIILCLLSVFLITGCSKKTSIEDDVLQTTLKDIEQGNFEESLKNVSNDNIVYELTSSAVKDIKNMSNPSMFDAYPVPTEVIDEIEELYNLYTSNVLQLFEVEKTSKKDGYIVSKVFIQYLDEDLFASNINEIKSHLLEIENNKTELNSYLQYLHNRYQEAFLNGVKQKYIEVYVTEENPDEIAYIVNENEVPQ